MKVNLSLLVGAVVLIIFIGVSAFTISKIVKRQAQEAAEPSPQPSPIEGFPTASSSPQTLGQANVPATQPESGISTDTIRIFITNPNPLTLISSPVKITGYTNLTSGVIAARVKDEQGQILGQSVTDTCTSSQSCSFEINMSFAKPQDKTGTVQILSLSDSGEQLLESLAVRF